MPAFSSHFFHPYFRGVLASADNAIKVICAAENGAEKVYTVIAKRAAAHGETPTTPTQPTQPTEPTQPTTPSVKDDGQSAGGNNLLLVLIVGVVCLATGLAIGLLIGKKKH